MSENPSSLTYWPVDESVPYIQEEVCHLCGLPVGIAGINEGPHRFCCPGCRQVFLILSDTTGDLPVDFRQTEIYRACMEAGIIRGNRAGDQEKARSEAEPNMPALELSFSATGMWCPACAWLIEEVLKRTPGALQPRVSFFSDTVRLRYLPHIVTPKEIMSHVEKLGYHASASGENVNQDKSKRDLLVRLGVSAILTMNAMMLSCALYFGFLHDLTPIMVAYFSYPLLAMAAPVVFYGGMPILRRAWAGARLGSTSMDTLVAVGMLAAFSYSVIQVIRGSIHLYFDTAAMLVTIVLLGRYIEMHARERVLSSVALEEISPQKVRLAGGLTGQWVGSDTVKPGDLFIVQSNERIPLDGLIARGSGLLDQSVITGEPVPMAKSAGEQVMAGSLLIDGKLEIEATRSARDGSLRQMADLMASALDGKNSGEQLADSVSRLFVPAVIAVTGVTGFTMWFFNLPAHEILLRCLTMLLISCPCALGIAAPLVKVAVIGLGRTKGLLIRNPEALGRIADLDTMVLDKTGTMTEGAFMLRRVICKKAGEREVLSRIAAIEAKSPHFLARELMRRTLELGLSVEEASAVHEFEGLGVTGIVGGKTVFAGNRRLLSLCNAKLPASIEEQAAGHEHSGMTVVFFGWGGSVLGFFVFGDRIRQGAVELVEWLLKRGMKVLLLSGDGHATTKAVAYSLGIKDFLGQAAPREKAEIIRKLQDERHKVGMVGDGVNDAGALAQADVGFAIGTGRDIMKEASDLVIPSERLSVIMDAFVLSRVSIRTVRQNLCFAFLYNAIAIPVAAAGLLNPLMAVMAMFMSSLTVIGNALRITRKRGIGRDRSFLSGKTEWLDQKAAT